MKNLPFFLSQRSGGWDITAETVKARRLALISSILSNMRDDLQATLLTEPPRAAEVKRRHAALLKDFMTTMKNNYQQLRQGTTVTGAYVEFVQKIVQFLKQYTSEIFPVLPFFTDSVAFPLPAADPTYVVGRLCGYAPKASDPGTAKQLSVFIQTVAQQAVADNQQSYLVNQLINALCIGETPAVDMMALRSVLLQGIFPAYLEAAFSSRIAFVIAQPILQSLPSILDKMIFDLRITQPSTLSSIVRSIMSISHAFIRGTEHLKDNPILFRQRHILSGLTCMLEAMVSNLSLLKYISSRTIESMPIEKLPLVVYMENFSLYAAEMILDKVPREYPVVEGVAVVQSMDDQYGELLNFCRKGLQDGIKANWTENHEAVWFGHGHASKEVVMDIGSVEEERLRVNAAIEEFYHVSNSIFSNEQDRGKEGRDFTNDIVV